MFFVDNKRMYRYIRAFPVVLALMSGNNSVVECNLAKVEVASSNLVSRSIFLQQFCNAGKVRHRSGLFLLTILRVRYINYALFVRLLYGGLKSPE